LALLLFKRKIEIYKESINNNMSNKFLTLVENSIARYSNGGLLTGDTVKFVKNFKSKDSYKALSDNLKRYIDEFIKTDKNLRVVDIKTMFPSRAPGDSYNRGNGFSIEIAIELAPGSYDLQNKFTIPSDLVEPVNNYSNLPSIPDSIRKKEKIQHKPAPPEEDEEVLNNPYVQTLMSQDGNSLRRTETKLLNKNVKIPAVTAKGAANPMVKGFNKVYTPLPNTIKN
jgi:hypothetical protein